MRSSKSMEEIPKTFGIGMVHRESDERPGQLSFFGAGGLGAAVALGEFLNTARGVDKLLLTGEKRVASSADTDSNVAPGRAGPINRPTRANHLGLVIFWMNAR